MSKSADRLQWMAAALGSAAMLISPSTLIADSPESGGIVSPPVRLAQRDVAVRDVALEPGGILRGQVVQPDGTPVTGARVTLRSANQTVAATSTNERGEFVVSGLRGGVYQIVLGDMQRTIRAWSANTAPATARSGVLLVRSVSVVRGQAGGVFSGILGSPLAMAGVMAAAMVTPAVVVNSINDKSPSS